MIWARYVVRIEEMINAYDILVGKSGGRNHSEDLGVDGKILLEWIIGR
jgi:hypothetical protein